MLQAKSKFQIFFTKSVSHICINYEGMGRGKKISTSFSPVTSASVGISFQNFLTFIFNTFAKLVWNFKAIPSASFEQPRQDGSGNEVESQIIELEPKAPFTKTFFWSNPYKMKVMITSLIEMLELSNFGNMTPSTIWFELCNKILFVTSEQKLWCHKFFLKYILKCNTCLY